MLLGTPTPTQSEAKKAILSFQVTFHTFFFFFSFTYSFFAFGLHHYYRGVSGGARGGGQLAAELWGMSWRSSEMALNDYSW